LKSGEKISRRKLNIVKDCDLGFLKELLQIEDMSSEEY